MAAENGRDERVIFCCMVSGRLGIAERVYSIEGRKAKGRCSHLVFGGGVDGWVCVIIPRDGGKSQTSSK